MTIRFYMRSPFVTLPTCLPPIFCWFMKKQHCHIGRLFNHHVYHLNSSIPANIPQSRPFQPFSIPAIIPRSRPFHSFHPFVWFLNSTMARSTRTSTLKAAAAAPIEVEPTSSGRQRTLSAKQQQIGQFFCCMLCHYMTNFTFSHGKSPEASRSPGQGLYPGTSSSSSPRRNHGLPKVTSSCMWFIVRNVNEEMGPESEDEDHPATAGNGVYFFLFFQDVVLLTLIYLVHHCYACTNHQNICLKWTYPYPYSSGGPGKRKCECYTSRSLISIILAFFHFLCSSKSTTMNRPTNSHPS